MDEEHDGSKSANKTVAVVAMGVAGLSSIALLNGGKQKDKKHNVMDESNIKDDSMDFKNKPDRLNQSDDIQKKSKKKDIEPRMPKENVSSSTIQSITQPQSRKLKDTYSVNRDIEYQISDVNKSHSSDKSQIKSSLSSKPGQSYGQYYSPYINSQLTDQQKSSLESSKARFIQNLDIIDDKDSFLTRKQPQKSHLLDDDMLQIHSKRDQLNYLPATATDWMRGLHRLPIPDKLRMLYNVL